MNLEQIADVKRYGKTARGRLQLIKHLEGERLTISQAVLAYCYGCMGYFADGKLDCRMPHCPLHSFMAYNESKIKRKTGRVMTAEHKEKMQEARQM